MMLDRLECADRVTELLADFRIFNAALAFTEGQDAAGSQADAALNLALRAARENAGTNIQVHGGMGFSAECDAHLYLKAARLLDAACGGLSESRRRLMHYS
jgi:alkylation response protein AidB-like acyl-CoA dehydrogenase